MSQSAKSAGTTSEFGQRDGVLPGNGLADRQIVFTRGRLQQGPRLWLLQFGDARR